MLTNKAQALWEMCFAIVVFCGIVYGVWSYGNYRESVGYEKGYAKSVLDRPTYTVETGGKVNVEAVCKGFGLHIFKGVLGLSW